MVKILKKFRRIERFSVNLEHNLKKCKCKKNFGNI